MARLFFPKEQAMQAFRSRSVGSPPFKFVHELGATVEVSTAYRLGGQGGYFADLSGSVESVKATCWGLLKGLGIKGRADLRQWLYFDDEEVYQGPFSDSLLKAWNAGGHLSGDRMLKHPKVEVWVSMETLGSLEAGEEHPRVRTGNCRVDSGGTVEIEMAQLSLNQGSGANVEKKQASNRVEVGTPSSCDTISAVHAGNIHSPRSTANIAGDRGTAVHGDCTTLDTRKSVEESETGLQSAVVKPQQSPDSPGEGPGYQGNQSTNYPHTGDQSPGRVTKRSTNVVEMNSGETGTSQVVPGPQQTVVKGSDMAHHGTGVGEPKHTVSNEQLERDAGKAQVNYSQVWEQEKVHQQPPLNQGNQGNMSPQTKRATMHMDSSRYREHNHVRGQGEYRSSGGSLQEGEDGPSRWRRGPPEKRTYKPGTTEQSIIDQIQEVGPIGSESQWGNFIREASQIGIMGLSGLLQHIMELVCKEMWPYLVIKEPPWNFPDILRVLQKHWRSLFDDHLPRIVQVQRDELETVLRTAKKEGATAELALRMTGCLRHLLRVVPNEWKEGDELSDEEGTEDRKYRRVTREEAMENLAASQNEASRLSEECCNAAQEAINGQRNGQWGGGEATGGGWGDGTGNNYNCYNRDQQASMHGRYLNQDSRSHGGNWQKNDEWGSNGQGFGWGNQRNNRDFKGHWGGPRQQPSMRSDEYNRRTDSDWNSQTWPSADNQNTDSLNAETGWGSYKHQGNSRWRSQTDNRADAADCWAANKVDQDWNQPSTGPSDEWRREQDYGPSPQQVQSLSEKRSGGRNLNTQETDWMSEEKGCSHQCGIGSNRTYGQASMDRSMTRQDTGARRNWAESPAGRGFQNRQRGGHMQHQASRQYNNWEGVQAPSETKHPDSSNVQTGPTRAAAQEEIVCAGTGNHSTQDTSWGPQSGSGHQSYTQEQVPKAYPVKAGEGGPHEAHDFTIPAENKLHDECFNTFSAQESNASSVQEAGKFKSGAQPPMPLSKVGNICSEAGMERGKPIPPGLWKKNEMEGNQSNTVHQWSTAQGNAMFNSASLDQEREKSTEEFKHQKVSMTKPETIGAEDKIQSRQQDWDWIYKITAAFPLQESGELGKLIAIRDLIREIAEHVRCTPTTLTPSQKSALREVADSFTTFREKMKFMLLDDCVGDSMVVFQVSMSSFLTLLFDQQTMLTDQVKAALARFTNDCPEDMKETFHLWMINGVMDKVVHFFHNVSTVLIQHSQI